MGKSNSHVRGGLIPGQSSATMPCVTASPSPSGGRPRAKPARLMIGFLVFQQCLAMGCAESASQRARRLEAMLTQAGFRVVPANTPARTERLKQITPLKLKYVSRNGKRSYWFADPDVCHCLYVGSQHNYDEYQQFKEERAEAVTQENEQTIYDEFMASPAGEVFYGEQNRSIPPN